MKSFVRYDKSNNCLICDDDSKIPNFCKKCLNNETKKCNNYYKKMLIGDKEGLFECPYGFYSFYKKHTIYTSIILKDKNNKKVNSTLKLHNDKITNYNMYNELQFNELMDDYDQIYTNNIELRDCMHDLRNMGGYFNSMSEKIEIKHQELATNDEDVKAMLALYDLINYRLNVYYGMTGVDNKIIKAKLYPLIKKLQVMMKYQAKKKKINFKIDYEQDNIVLLSKNIYLVMFILMENAVKHSPHNGEISVNFEENKEKTVMCISNKSPLIEEEEYNKIFERGYRGKNTVSKGSGIGLSLVKEILEKQNYIYNINIVRINDNECMFNFIINFSCV